jgi:hypothetical protein
VRAYFEDIANSRMVRVAVGEPSPAAGSRSIGLDAVEYEHAATAAAQRVERRPAHASSPSVTILTGKVSNRHPRLRRRAMATTSP